MERFEELVIQNLGEIKDALSDVQNKTSDLCTRHGIVEEKVKNLEIDWKTHINEEIQTELRKRDNKWKIPAIIFGGIASIATIVNFFK